MTTKKQEAQQERDKAVAFLRELFPPGATVYTILRHVSRSGMQRSISVLSGKGEEVGDVSWAVARAVGLKFDRDRGGVKIGGCGMDMGFSLAYELSYALHPDGFGCIGEGCPSNDHSNGDRDYTTHGSIGGCQTPESPCTCHDDTAWTPEAYPNGCSGCGCHWINHWHKDGGYALRHRWV